MSLRETASRTFDIRTLPKLDAILGFSITTPVGISCEEVKRSLAGTVLASLALRSKTGDIVVQHKDHLVDWVWSYALPPNPPRAPAPMECFVYSRALDFSPTNKHDFDLVVTIESAANTSIVVTPTLKSYAVYTP
jgi:hypothetical protein